MPGGRVFQKGREHADDEVREENAVAQHHVEVRLLHIVGVHPERIPVAGAQLLGRHDGVEPVVVHLVLGGHEGQVRPKQLAVATLAELDEPARLRLHRLARTRLVGQIPPIRRVEEIERAL